MAVRIRGIYATALTEFLPDVVQASDAIRERFADALPPAPADARVETTADRQGVGVHGDPECVHAIGETLADVGLDAFDWSADLPSGAVYAGEVTDTLGGGALVAVGDGTGFLPYSATTRRIETGDRVRVQVAEPKPPWVDDRPVLDARIRVERGLATLVRGGTATAGGPDLADVLPQDPPDGWAVSWSPTAEAADLDALGEALDGLRDVAESVDEALAAADPPDAVAPARYWVGDATAWVWFGRESRFALDETRREVTPTMAGHHRIKAATDAASAAVDFVEAVGHGPDLAAAEFPFAAVTRQFGPTEGDVVAIGHGKPDGRRIELGQAAVTERATDGTVKLRREMTPGGSYDGLGVERRAGDVAITTVKEGRWWYPTAYRGADGQRRGTYVNVCTPVEVFPEEVRYVDLHVDVVQHANGEVERLDDDELDEAVDAGHVSEPLAAKARSVASAVESALDSG